MATKTEKLRFVYLSYTRNSGGFECLMGVYRSKKAARSWFDLIDAEEVPITDSLKRVMQKYKGEQIWWVEKHVVRNGY